MSAMAALTAETFTRLRRDRIFLPALITGALLMAIAHVASGWGIFEFHRILYDAGLTGYELTGVFVALVWSTGILADAKDSGALELSLATPLSRSMWIIAHYAGLCLVLLILAGIMLVCWQLVLFATGLSWITWPYLQVFLMATAGWMVVAALGILLGTLAGRGIAIFCTLGLWMAGQVTGPVYHALPDKVPETTRFLVEKLALYWNLSSFSPGFWQHGENTVSLPDAGLRFLIAGLLCVILTCLSCMFFSRRDL